MNAIKIKRSGKEDAKNLLSRIIPTEEFLTRNPSAKELELYKKIKAELVEGAKKGFISEVTFTRSTKKAKAKPISKR